MDDAAARSHQVARAGTDRGEGAEAVAMVDRAFEKIGDGREVDMWVRAHVHALPDVEMRRAELVDEDEGPDHRPRLVGQGPDRKSVGEGRGVEVRLDTGGRRNIQKQK